MSRRSLISPGACAFMNRIANRSTFVGAWAVLSLALSLGSLAACNHAYSCTDTNCVPGDKTTKPYRVCNTGDGATSYEYGSNSCQCADKTNCSACDANIVAWCAAASTDAGTSGCVPTTCGSATYEVCTGEAGSRRYDYGRFTCACANTADCVECETTVAAWCARPTDGGSSSN